MTPRALKIAATVLGAMVLFICVTWWWLFSIPFSQSTLNKLTPGMSQAQVLSILGPPTQKGNLAHGGSLWCYQHCPSFVVLDVEFDVGGRFVSYVRD